MPLVRFLLSDICYKLQLRIVPKLLLKIYIIHLLVKFN